MTDLVGSALHDTIRSALKAAIRQGELNAREMIETALVVRDLKTAIRQAIEAIDRKSYETARCQLKQALDEMPSPQRRRER